MPPGSATPSIRAAMLTPSPRMSSPSMMMSPTLIPIRNWIEFDFGATGIVLAKLALDFDSASDGVPKQVELGVHPGFMRGLLVSSGVLGGLRRAFSMNDGISRRKLLFLAGLAASIVAPATVLIASNAEAQQTEQTPPAGQTAPKKKKKKKKGTSSSGAASETKQPKAQ